MNFEFEMKVFKNYNCENIFEFHHRGKDCFILEFVSYDFKKVNFNMN